MSTPADSTLTLSRGKRIAFSLILVLLVWGVLELIASLYLRQFRGYDGHHLYQYTFDPYKNILPAPNYVDTRGVATTAPASAARPKSRATSRRGPIGSF